MHKDDSTEIMLNDLEYLEQQSSINIKSELEECIKLLKVSGSNTKLAVIYKLEYIINNL